MRHTASSANEAAATISASVTTDPLTTPVGRRTGRAKNRHGRGHRGPLVLPGPLSPDARSNLPTPREAFDELTLSLVERLGTRWEKEWGQLDFGTEDVPQLPEDWTDEPVPLGALTQPKPGVAARIVVFRRPVELRAKTYLERTALVNEVLVEHLSQLLGRDPDEIDPEDRPRA